MEERIFFDSEGIQLEGLIETGIQTSEGFIITHPHSLYGGNMDNSVVETVCSACRNRGFPTLRFNFRGVGQSSGTFGSGIGEQQDVLAAVTYMKSRGISRVTLAGYSFGAWVIAHTPYIPSDIRSVMMISPPTAFMAFQPDHPIVSLSYVITGSQDEIAPSKEIGKWMPKWNPQATLKVIEGADHFYSGCLHELESVLNNMIRISDSEIEFLKNR